MNDYDLIFKVIVIGQSAVGKSSLMNRYVENMYVSEHVTTIGVDFRIKTIDIANKRVKLQIWDTAGQERFHSISVSYFRGANACMIVFALDDLRSFERVTYWMDLVEEQRIPYTILIGNKCDVDNPVVTDAMVAEFLTSHPNIRYLPTSAKTGQRVEEAFLDVVKTLVGRETMEANKERMIQLQDKQPEPSGTGGGGKCCGGTG